MRTIFPIIACFLLASCSSPQTFYNEAVKLGDQEKYKEAIELLDKAIDKDPGFLDAFIQRGYYQMNLDNYLLAAKDFERALSIDPRNTLALYDLGSCMYGLNDFNAALKYYNKALDTKGGQFVTIDWTDNPYVDNPGAAYDVPTVEIIFDRANSFRRLDSLKRAYFDYQHCIKKNYMVADSYYYIAYLYFASGKDDRGCEALHNSIKFGRKDIQPEYLKRCP